MYTTFSTLCLPLPDIVGLDIVGPFFPDILGLDIAQCFAYYVACVTSFPVHFSDMLMKSKNAQRQKLPLYRVISGF